MKKILFTILIFINWFWSFSQTADQKTASYLNEGDYLNLKTIYPLIKDSVSPFLQDLSESLLNSYFNKPEAACTSIQNFFTVHQAKIDAQLATSMIYLWAENLKISGLYKNAVELIDSYISNYPAEQRIGLRQTFHSLYHYCKAYQNFPKTQLNRPDKDVFVPIHFKPTGTRGETMYVPAMINGKLHDFVFDTGAGDNVVSERFARNNNIQILNDSVEMTGVTTLHAKLGFADSLQIGKLTARNLSFLVVSVPESDSLLNEPVLGMSFIRLFHEIQILPYRKQILFPEQESVFSDVESNLILRNQSLFVKTVSESRTMQMHFDTGSVESMLSGLYYKNNKELIRQNAIPDTVFAGGFGGTDTIAVYRISNPAFQIGQHHFLMKNTPVAMNKNLADSLYCSGTFGVDFIRLFERIILNLNQMKMELQNKPGLTTSLNENRNVKYRINSMNHRFNKADIHFKPGFKSLIHNISYYKFDVTKTEWEPTNLSDFTTKFRKVSQSIDPTKAEAVQK